MSASSRLRRWLTFAVLGGLALLAALPCLSGAAVYNQLHYRHVRAYQRWQVRQPYHYSYILSFLGSVTYQTYQVEVLGGKLVRLTDMATGGTLDVPSSASSSFIPINAWVNNNLMIDDMFLHILADIHPPNSVKAFISRANPAFYTRLTAAGWLPNGIASCDPGFPQAEYHPVYGFPEELFLAGEPCTSLLEYSYPVHLKIEAFQVLP